MIELEKHIETLLLDNDCVIIPNFGGFMAHPVHAHYEEQDQLYYPPLRTIGFNPQLTINDSLLAQSYVDVYDISYPEALRRIEREVIEIKEHLSNEGHFHLSDIGTLHYNNSEGIFTFIPCEAGILTPTLYGLSSLDITPISSATSTQQATQTILVEQAESHRNETDYAGDAKPSEEQLMPTEVKLPDTADDTGKTIRIKVSVIRNLVAACLVAVAFFLFPATLNHQGNNAKLFGNIDTSLLYHIMPKDIITGSVDLPNDAPERTEAKPILKETKAAEPIKKEVEEKTTAYVIVLASRVTVRNANAYVEKLHQAGYSQAKVYTKNKSTRVIYGQYETERAAYNALNNLQNQKEFADGWVLKLSPISSH